MFEVEGPAGLLGAAPPGGLLPRLGRQRGEIDQREIEPRVRIDALHGRAVHLVVGRAQHLVP
ncbi:hypothetical protein B5180_29780, partial [Streptomyces sp. BF-3]